MIYVKRQIILNTETNECEMYLYNNPELYVNDTHNRGKNAEAYIKEWVNFPIIEFNQLVTNNLICTTMVDPKYGEIACYITLDREYGCVKENESKSNDDLISCLNKICGIPLSNLVSIMFKNLQDKYKPKYDCTADTLKHITRINEMIHIAVKNLLDRADKHDRSKLSGKEKATFDEFTPKLANSTYGSDQYKGFLKDMQVALDNHYMENKNHHPDKLPDGILSMSLLDLLEMIIDWKAASERHNNGDILKSIEFNQSRFKMSDDLVRFFLNTVREFGWADPDFKMQIDVPIDDDPIETKMLNTLQDVFGITLSHTNFGEIKPHETVAEVREFSKANGSHWWQYTFQATNMLPSKRKEIKDKVTEVFKDNGVNVEVFG